MNTPTKTLRIAVGLLALLMVTSPLTGFAKENESRGKGKDDNKKELKASVRSHDDSDDDSDDSDDDSDDSRSSRKSDDSDDRSDKKCLRAFGHAISSGWNKKNATTTIGVDCWLPFGISKKFHGTTTRPTTTRPTTTADTIAPVISSIVSKPALRGAVISWSTNEKSQSIIYYATTSAALDVNSSSTPRVIDRSFEKSHSEKISGLATSTTYYFKIATKDRAGNTSYSDTQSFTTKTPEVKVVYPVISRVATLSGTSTAQVGWRTNEPATSKVYYSTSTVSTEATSTAFVFDGALSTNHSMTVSGLATSTTYNFVIESKNAQGNKTLSNSFSVTTKN